LNAVSSKKDEARTPIDDDHYRIVGLLFFYEKLTKIEEPKIK
jgi:hypothetical protein